MFFQISLVLTKKTCATTNDHLNNNHLGQLVLLCDLIWISFYPAVSHLSAGKPTGCVIFYCFLWFNTNITNVKSQGLFICCVKHLINVLYVFMHSYRYYANYYIYCYIVIIIYCYILFVIDDYILNTRHILYNIIKCILYYIEVLHHLCQIYIKHQNKHKFTWHVSCISIISAIKQ